MSYTENEEASPHYFEFVREDNWQSANIEALLETSLKYSTGDGVEVDYIMAHVWLNVAATMGSQDAKEQRRQLSLEMTQEDIAKAQKIARQLLHARGQMH